MMPVQAYVSALYIAQARGRWSPPKEHGPPAPARTTERFSPVDSKEARFESRGLASSRIPPSPCSEWILTSRQECGQLPGFGRASERTCVASSLAKDRLPAMFWLLMKQALSLSTKSHFSCGFFLRLRGKVIGPKCDIPSAPGLAS